MIRFLGTRILQSLVALLVMSVLVFLAIYAIGNPVEVLIDPRATPAEIERTMKALGLDKPLWEQYFLFLSNLLQGDIGNSWVYHEPAIELMLGRMSATLELALAALFLANIIGIPLGLFAGFRHGSKSSQLVMSGSILGLSVPAFWVGLMLIWVFGVQLAWLPMMGRGETVIVFGISFSFLTADGLAHLLMPAFTLALSRIAMVIRLVNAGVREVALQDYIKFARAKGLHERRIISVHILKNVLVPLITVLGVDFAGLLAFAVVTETVFAWPGMGKLIIDSIAMLDRPMIVAYLMMTVLIFIFVNLVVDLLYGIIDPRVSLSGAKK